MKRTLFVYALSVAAALTFCRTAAQAQTASFLNVNPDPEAMSLAGTGTVMEANAFSIWNNNAASALGGERFQVGAAYSLWQPSFSSNSNIAVAGYGRIAKFMTISAGFKYFSHQPYEVSGTEPGMVSGTFTPVEMQAVVGLGFKVLPILSLSANVGYVHSDIGGPKKGGAVSADFGALLDLKFLRVGLTASNIGSRIDYGGASSYGLPANIKLGAGTIQRFGSEDKHAVAVNLQGGMTFENPAFFAALGAQYCFNDFIRVAAGYHYGDPDKIAQALEEAGCTGIYEPRTLLGLTALEKVVGRKRFAELAGAYIVKTPGKPALVPDSDPRAPIMEDSKTVFGREDDA